MGPFLDILFYRYFRRALERARGIPILGVVVFSLGDRISNKHPFHIAPLSLVGEMVCEYICNHAVMGCAVDVARWYKRSLPSVIAD